MKLELKQIKPGKDLSLNCIEWHLLENLLVLYIILSLFHFIFFLYFIFQRPYYDKDPSILL